MRSESSVVFQSIIQRHFRTPSSFTAAALVVLFFMIMHTPFLGQAFHMDDAIYLILARNVSRNPAFPQDVGVHVEGIWADDLASMEHPPLTTYILAAGAWLARGFSEVPLHALFLVFTAVLGFSMYSLSSRFTCHPLAATALLLSAPVVFVMSNTLMTDLPHLALWVLAIALFTRGVDEEKAHWVHTGAAAAAVATYISPAALSLVPLLALYAFLKKRPRYGMPAILLPFLAQGFWWLANYSHYGRFTPGFVFHYYFASERVLALQALSRKSLYAVLAVGGLTVSPVVFCCTPFRRFLWLGLPLGVGTAVVSEARDYPWLLVAAFVLFFACGFAAIAGSLSHVFKQGGADAGRTAECFLAIWLLGALLLAVLFYMTGSARYLLPAVPPLVLLAVRRLEASMDASRFRIVGGAAILTTCLLSLALGVADFRFAEVYRDFASHLKSVPDLGTRRIWFTGEWGLRAYLEPIGGQELGRRDARPRPRDLLVVPSLAVPYSTLFSKNVSHESIVMVAPSRIRFEVPALHRPGTLYFLIGMPYWRRSDGLDFLVQWGDRVLFSQRLLPEDGRAWRPVEIPLPESEQVSNKLVLSAQVGVSENADADWVAVSHARVRTVDGQRELVHFSLRAHLSGAEVSADRQVNYHTPENRPVFEMPVWLDQEAPARALSERRYAPSWPVRLLDARSRAGFWSMGWGLLPFSATLDRTPLEEIRIFEITRTVDGFDEHDPSWYSR
jgi:hypothetical protein